MKGCSTIFPQTSPRFPIVSEVGGILQELHSNCSPPASAVRSRSANLPCLGARAGDSLNRARSLKLRLAGCGPAAPSQYFTSKASQEKPSLATPLQSGPGASETRETGRATSSTNLAAFAIHPFVLSNSGFELGLRSHNPVFKVVLLQGFRVQLRVCATSCRMIEARKRSNFQKIDYTVT